MPFGPTDILWIGVIPCAFAAAVMWIASRLALRPTACWTLSIASGLVLGLIAQNFRISPAVALEKLFHPRVALDWLPWLVLLIAAMQLLSAYAPRDWKRWLLVLAFVVAIAVPLRLLAGSVYVTQRWTMAEKFGVLVAWSLVFAAMWIAFSIGGRNRFPLLRSGLLLVVVLGVAITLAASGALTLGELAGVAAAALAGAVAVAWITGNLADGPTHAAGPLVMTLFGLLFIGYFYSQLTIWNTILLAVSLSAAVGHLPLPLGEGRVEDSPWRSEGASRPAWTAVAIRACLTLIPLVIAVASAISTASTTANPYG